MDGNASEVYIKGRQFTRLVKKVVVKCYAANNNGRKVSNSVGFYFHSGGDLIF